MANASGARGFDNGHANNGPPPSTLAAQLVENIAPSAKSSRSDENVELKGLFAQIQRIKDDPELLKTSEQRVEHNHMLIYVYCRAVLENIKLDDPFLDRDAVRAEVLKAINFLRFTIKETPAVLDHRAQNEQFLFRGQEPLWAWLLPQLLRMLGHAQCLDLQASIEGFLQYLVLVASRCEALRSVVPLIGVYFRAALTDLLDHLQDASTRPSHKDSVVSFTVPGASANTYMFGSQWPYATRETSYTITQSFQALRQTSALAKILAYPVASNDSAFDFVPWTENASWLLDALVDLRQVQKRWETSSVSQPFFLIEVVEEMIGGLKFSSNTSNFSRDKAHVLLTLICSDIVASPGELVLIDASGDSARLTFCRALIIIAQALLLKRSLGRLAESRLVNELILLSAQYPAVGEGTDVWRCTELLRHTINFRADHPLDDKLHPSQFSNDGVRVLVEHLQFRYQENYDKPAKRPKISNESSGTDCIAQRIGEVFQIKLDCEHEAAFKSAFLQAFESSDEQTQCLVLSLMSQVFCPQKGPVAGLSQVQRDGDVSECPVCDTESHHAGLSSVNNAKAAVWLGVYMDLIKSESFLNSKRPRIAAMQALWRLAIHCDEPSFLNLETSASGQWCIQSLNSSVRELRIAAGRTLMAFVDPSRLSTRSNLTADLFARNRQNAMALLKSFSEQQKPSLTETCIMAWGQMGCFVEEAELNLVLLQLLEYLGDSNNIVSAFAFNEVVRLAERRGTQPRRLFEPFWRNLAYVATKDMVRRPQRSRAVAELLQMSVNELLLLIQAHALPWLVLDRQKDTIQKIAEARNQKETWEPLMDGVNLAGTLSLLLVQDAEDIEAFVTSRLIEVSSHLEDQPLAKIFQSEPVLTIMELLKIASDGEPNRQKLARRALQTVSAMGSTSTGKNSKGKAGLGRFLQNNLLGLMARFTDTISDPNAPVMEQRRCIRALEELIKLCQGYARLARPQISACLLSALPQGPLQGDAFSCWSAMLFSFEAEDLEKLLETTFFIVHRYWEYLDGRDREVVKNMLSFLLDKHEASLIQNIHKLPSFRAYGGLADLEARLARLRPSLTPEAALEAFAERIGNETSGVAQLGLVELAPYLELNQNAMYDLAASQRPDNALSTVLRALLDCACKYNGVQSEISKLCMECIGLVGCVDSNQIEATREQRSIVILDNFDKPEETTDFGLFVLEHIMVPAFLSATDTRTQGFLSYAMQELLERCDVKAACAFQSAGMVEDQGIYRKWLLMPETVREILTPFLTSRYTLVPLTTSSITYPVFSEGKTYTNWLRTIVMDLLRKGQNIPADILFEPLTRVIRVKDLSIAEFMLPYLVLHVLLGQRASQDEKDNLMKEIRLVLESQPGRALTYAENEDRKRFYHAIFRVLDYAMRWVQSKRTATDNNRKEAKKDPRRSKEDRANLEYIQRELDTIPPQSISYCAVQCNDYARALLHLEQHAQKIENEKRRPGERTELLREMQRMYANIDEPDGLEGISAHLPALDIHNQILSHKKAGRWTAAQTWYEMQLAEQPDNVDVQVELLNCLKQAGQHDVLLHHVEGMHVTSATNAQKIMPFAVEAAWVTNRWESLAKFTQRFQGSPTQDFNISVATLLETLRTGHRSDLFYSTLAEIRSSLATTMSMSATSSLQSAHEQRLKCHVLADMDLIVRSNIEGQPNRDSFMAVLEGRLGIMGAYFSDKQYLLGIRRALMTILSDKGWSNSEISNLWLTSARLARKSNSLPQSLNAVLHASQLGDDGATIENAKLLWRDNHHRKAIQMLQGAIERKKFGTQAATATAGAGSRQTSPERLLTARAQLLLAKWLDNAGQTYAGALREKYQQPPKTCGTWEKGHYYLGRYYKKILESQKALKADDQTDPYTTGEIARLVIENYLRSLNYGTKYLYQTLPRVLTLWLDLGVDVDKPQEGKASLPRELHECRKRELKALHISLDKYIQRLPAYIFYTALPQIVARIAHPNASVFDRLRQIIVKVVEAHPREALWTLIGIITTKQVSDRKTRGLKILQSLREGSRRTEPGKYDLKTLIRAGEKLAEQLLLACHNGDFPHNKSVHTSLTRDLRFNHKCTPCPLVVPVEASLTATLPAVSEQVKTHKAFSRDVVSIESFLDEVLVLSSLAKPRRLTARGSDGKNYMLLIKPKDDLRTDQRLMEFNGMINRSLKRDAESSRRQLYIRTYAVVPLNEECGIIEWIPGIKTMRDILLGLYSSRRIFPDYMQLKQLMEDASRDDSKIGIFTNDVLGQFPPLLHLWFIQQFPNPSQWFAARLRYTRSCAVMSMVGTILGLGDRHGENVNIEEGNGGIFHVDFNCLFDKGLTFARPERVPFRLTHNMTAAMGIYGVEGPFRKSSELTLSILRQQEETLMTILEAFIYDPTLDLQKDKRAAKKGDNSIKLQPQSVVDSIKRKVRGLLPSESIPLSVEGQVEELIKQAVDPRNLTAMYIGWCPFL